MGSSPAYPSDLTDAQWALIEPLVPAHSSRGKGTRGGRPLKYARRRIVDAILYVDRTGCSWRQLPHDFPPWERVYFYFQRWAADGTPTASTSRSATRSGMPPGGIRWPRPARWTPRRCPARRPAVGLRAATTPARRSSAASGTWWWTPWAC